MYSFLCHHFLHKQYARPEDLRAESGYYVTALLSAMQHLASASACPASMQRMLVREAMVDSSARARSTFTASLPQSTRENMEEHRYTDQAVSNDILKVPLQQHHTAACNAFDPNFVDFYRSCNPTWSIPARKSGRDREAAEWIACFVYNV